MQCACIVTNVGNSPSTLQPRLIRCSILAPRTLAKLARGKSTLIFATLVIQKDDEPELTEPAALTGAAVIATAMAGTAATAAAVAGTAPTVTSASGTAVADVTTSSPAQSRNRHARQLIEKYPTVFTGGLPTGLPPSCPGVDHDLREVLGSAPPNGPVYCLSHLEQEALRTWLKEEIDAGHIRPSSSPYGSPVLFVLKPMAHFVCVSTIVR